jgi:uncharacterized protein (TIGR01777 family)
MRVAISGSHGLVGTALAHELRTGSHEVLRLVRPGADSGPGSIRWDPVTGELDRSAADGLDAVVHLAGANIGDKRWTAERKRELVESRVGPTAALATSLAGLDRPPRVLVSGSAVGYYGSRGDEVLTETSAPGDDFLARLCREWEADTAPAADAGIRVVTIRSGVVLTPKGGALARQLPFFRVGLGGRLGPGTQYLSWIAIDDHVRAVSWLLDHDVSGPVNLTAPTPVTNADFTKALGAVLHRPTLLPTPGFGPKLMFGSELIDTMVYASQRALPQVLDDGGFTFEHPDIEGALRAVLERPAA